MPFAKPTFAELSHRFRHHPPIGDQAERYGQVREAILAAAQEVVRLTPCSPEQARALNSLDEAMMLANAAIARNETAPAGGFPDHVAQCDHVWKVLDHRMYKCEKCNGVRPH